MAYTGLAEDKPDIVIMDIGLPGSTGINCIRIIAALLEIHEGGFPMSLSIARKVVSSFQRPAGQNQLSEGVRATIFMIL